MAATALANQEKQAQLTSQGSSVASSDITKLMLFELNRNWNRRPRLARCHIHSEEFLTSWVIAHISTANVAKKKRVTDQRATPNGMGKRIMTNQTTHHGNRFFFAGN